MKQRYRYRFYPNAVQATELARLFGCSRVVWNNALAFCRAKTEVALSAPISERIEVEPSTASTHSVKILAILGSSEDIDIQVDRQFLATLPSAQTTFLVEPSRAQIDQQLWQQSSDILFFAGHSSTEGDRGLIHITGVAIFLYGLYFLGLLRGHWLPFILLMVALVSSSVLIALYLLVHSEKSSRL